MDKYLNQTELARVFNVSRKQVAAWLLEGCPSYNMKPNAKRGFFRFSVEEVAAWLKERATAGKEVAQ